MDKTLEDIKARLSGETVDYRAWVSLNDHAFYAGEWINTTSYRQNRDQIHFADLWQRPDLLIPVALSMVPEGLEWIIYPRAAIVTDYDNVRAEAKATYPANALALAVIEARM